MVSVAPIVVQPVPQPVGEKRLVFRGLNWQRYQALRAILSRSTGNAQGDQRVVSPIENRNIHFTYLHGTMEVTMPLEVKIHAFATGLIDLFIRILVVALGMKVKTMGSTTLEQEALDRSAEPDNAYDIQNQPLVSGRDVDLERDPPPDLLKTRLFSLGSPQTKKSKNKPLAV